MNSISEGVGEDPVQPIHIIWYCISITNERIQDIDIQILQQLLQESKIRKRVCIVFTKCDEDSEDSAKANALKCEIDKRLGVSIKAFETSSLKGFEPELDLPKLIRWSADSIDDDDLRAKFVAAQMPDLELKYESAKKIIAATSAAAAVIGAAALPISDAIPLTTAQVTMVAKIIDIYGVSDLAKISAATIGDTIISNIGKSFVTSILKVIPIIGQLANVVVASTITFALGFAVSKICYSSVKRYLKGETVIWERLFDTDEFTNIFVEALKIRNAAVKD